MQMYPNTIWPKEDYLEPIGEFLIKIPSVTSQEELAEYCRPFLGTILGDLPFTGLQYRCEQEFARAISGKSFMAEIYEVKGIYCVKPPLFEIIAKYRERKLLGVLGGMAFLTQYPEVFFNKISSGLGCLPNDHGYVADLEINEYNEVYRERKLVYPQSTSGLFSHGDNIIYYRGVH